MSKVKNRPEMKPCEFGGHSVCYDFKMKEKKIKKPFSLRASA